MCTYAFALSSFLRGDAPDALCPDGEFMAGHHDVIMKAQVRYFVGGPQLDLMIGK